MFAALRNYILTKNQSHASLKFYHSYTLPDQYRVYFRRLFYGYRLRTVSLAGVF